MNDVVNKWFVEKIACDDIARDTLAYNQAFAAKDSLAKRLEGATDTTHEISVWFAEEMNVGVLARNAAACAQADAAKLNLIERLAAPSPKPSFTPSLAADAASNKE